MKLSDNVLLKHNVIVRKISNQYFILENHTDYSKAKIPEISLEAVSIVEYIKRKRTVCEIVNKFSPKCSEESIKSFLIYLKNNGFVYIYDNSHDKKFISDLVSTKWSQERNFYGCTIELLPSCNFRCVHCYLDENHGDNKLMTTKQIKNLIDKLYNAGLLMVFFSGGEVFLRSDLEEIYIYTRKKGILVEFYTNGSLIDDHWIEIFKECSLTSYLF